MTNINTQFTCYPTTDIKYNTNKTFNAKTTVLKIVDNSKQEDNIKIHYPVLEKTYSPTNKPKTLRYVKKELYNDIIEFIRHKKLVNDNASININFKNITINMSKLPKLNSEKPEYIVEKKCSYKEYVSWYDYFASAFYNHKPKDEYNNVDYKPFYSRTYPDINDVEDKLDREFKKIIPSIKDGKLYDEVCNVLIDHISGTDVYYKDNDDGSFEIARLIHKDRSGLDSFRNPTEIFDAGRKILKMATIEDKIAKTLFGNCYKWE